MTERDAIIQLTELIRTLAHRTSYEIGTEEANRIMQACDDIATELIQ